METKIILFKNWTNEDFTWKWDNNPYEFKSQSVTPLPEYLFDHFAKHLAQRELNKVNRLIYLEDPEMIEMIEKCRYEEKQANSIEVEVAQIQSIAQIEEPKNEEVKEELKKRGRPKKELKEEIKSSEEFEGLSN